MAQKLIPASCRGKTNMENPSTCTDTRGKAKTIHSLKSFTPAL